MLALATPSLLAQGRARGDNREVIILDNITENVYTVKRYMVKEKSSDNDEFKMRYRVNLTKLLSSYDNNSQEIAKLHDFINAIKEDSMKHITRFAIVGYTSPDGPSALNSKLALLRATDCESFIDKECGMSAYPRTVKGVCSTWADTRTSLQGSNVPNRAAVISEINEGGGEMVIEGDLKKMPSSWAFICKNTLPPMRCVDIELCYNSWRLVEEREIVEEPTPRTLIIDMGYRNSPDAYAGCVLFAMPDQPIDFKDCKDRSHRRGKKGGRKDKERAKYKYSRRGEKLKESTRDAREKEREKIRESYRNTNYEW